MDSSLIDQTPAGQAPRTPEGQYLEPVVRGSFGWVLLGEPVGASALVGGALAVAGVFVVNRAG